jgi:uncharacterized membrane protein
MNSASVWALSLAYWLHMLATIAWIGGLAALPLLVLPAARQGLAPGDYAVLLERIQRRLDPLSWFCLAVLLGTGMFQMSASPSYQGFLTITNRWSTAMLAKHIVFLVMIAISAYMTWGCSLPCAAMLCYAPKEHQPRAEPLARREMILLQTNFVLG